MSRKYVLFGRRLKPSSTDHAEPCHQLEERLSASLASLRRLTDFKQNPLTLTRAIDRVYDAALLYQRWRESGAIIRDVILRLSDGSEIKVDKATPTNTNLFGFRFRTSFPPGSVLNVYKGADQEFQEVLLYSIDLDVIPTDGQTFTMTYENGQMLMLRIEPSLPRQFQISVDYTMSGSAISVPPPRPRHPFELLPTLAQLAAVCLLAALAMMAWQKYAAERDKHDKGVAPANVQASPTNPIIQSGKATDAETRRTALAGLNVNGDFGAQDSEVAPRQKRLPTSEADALHGPNDVLTLPAAGGQQTPAAVNNKHAAVQRLTHIRQAAPATPTSQVTSGGAPATAELSQQSQIPIYIKVWTGDKRFDQRMEKAFAVALAKTNRFNVLSGDDSVPRFYYEVSLWFRQAEDRGGTIYYDLHVPNTQSIQKGALDCPDIRQERLIESASQQLVKEVIYKIDTSRVASVNFDPILQTFTDFDCATCAPASVMCELTDCKAATLTGSSTR